MTYQPKPLGQWYYESRCETKPWGELTGDEQQSWERAAIATRDMLNSATDAIRITYECSLNTVNGGVVNLG